MHTLLSAYNNLKEALTSIYDAQEADAIAHMVMESITGLSKMQRLLQKTEQLTPEQGLILIQYEEQLLKATPVQYVLGKAWFMGQEYIVNEQVLIPRPETEELVQWITNDAKDKASLSIIDIGTGSGCIPIALKQSLPNASIQACDVSEGALQTAQENAKSLHAEIDFTLLDFLNAKSQEQLGQYDIIVSNPPYIPQNYKAEMHGNVKDFEPEIALFVPNIDPLLFYRAIADFGATHLNENGAIYCELHKDHALPTKDLFEEKNYTTVMLKEDMYGNLRMLKATK